MTQRLKGISDEEATGVVKQIFDTSNQLLGRTANLVRILCHSPYVARWFLPLVAAVRQPTAGAVSDVRLRKEFNEAEIVEISMACAMFNMINRLNDSFRTELESEEYNRRQHGAVGVTARALEDYACRICADSKSE